MNSAGLFLLRAFRKHFYCATMPSIFIIVKTLLAGFAALPRVSGELTFNGICLVRQILNQNAMSVQSYDGGADHGHLVLIMMPI
jgi:hypothetical protein